MIIEQKLVSIEDYWNREPFTTHIVNTVNTKSVMGKGIALGCKNKYPEVFEEYRKHCKSGLFEPGDVFICQANDNRFIINAATKEHWKNPSQYQWVSSCLKRIRNWMEGIPDDLKMCLMGCGNGRLDKKRVIDMTYDTLESLKNRVYLMY